ncbi:MAG: hypothetical protein LBF83_08625 [Spirochaetaceae bacterium]|nr:hypothetical protein [Spirochaetaceae bacterium]
MNFREKFFCSAKKGERSASFIADNTDQSQKPQTARLNQAKQGTERGKGTARRFRKAGRLPVKTFRAFSTAAPKLVSKRRLYWRRAMLHNRANALNVSGAALGIPLFIFF